MSAFCKTGRPVPSPAVTARRACGGSGRPRRTDAAERREAIDDDELIAAVACDDVALRELSGATRGAWLAGLRGVLPVAEVDPRLTPALRDFAKLLLYLDANMKANSGH